MWLTEKMQLCQKRRMKQRTMGSRRQYIRWFEDSRRRAASCKSYSTGWTDGGSGGSSDNHEITNGKVWCRTLQHWMNRRLSVDPVGASCQMICVNSHVQWREMASSTGWTDANERGALVHLMVLLSAVFSQRLFGVWTPWAIYTPSTHPFEVVGLCGSAEECKTLRRSYPIHPSAKLLI
jgi:hypothetical protein